MKKATADSTLGKTVASVQPLANYPAISPGYVSEKPYKFDYHKTVKECRQFYQEDPIAGTVVNRVVEIGITDLKNRRKNKNQKTPVSDEVMAYYNAVATALKEFLKQVGLQYVLEGMALPEYTTVRKMGNRASEYLGRTRYHFPDKMWCRNVDNIELVKLPTGADRLIFLKIPADEIRLIKEKGGKDKKEIYELLVQQFPDYVAAVEAGKKKFLITDIHPLYRKLLSYNDYPLPYMLNALDPMKHKSRLKAMDMSIASRVIEAVRQIKVGNDEFPADDDDIKAEQLSFTAYANAGEKIFNYFTNHTIQVVWSFPPFEALLNETKYREPNLEIFFALGFPRIWVNGETEKSNSADNSLAALGPLASIQDLRDSVISWVKWLYEQLAELNGFDKIPEPYFTPINMSDVANLIQYAEKFYSAGAISLETIAEFYGKDYAGEVEQREVEKAREKELEEKFKPDEMQNGVINGANPASVETQNTETETGVRSTSDET